MNFSLALQVLQFLLAHKDDIKSIITTVEGLIPDSPGSTKAAAVKQYIGVAMNVEAQLESAWPLVSPFFNAVVAAVKAPKAA